MVALVLGHGGDAVAMELGGSSGSGVTGRLVRWLGRRRHGEASVVARAALAQEDGAVRWCGAGQHGGEGRGERE